MSEFRACAVVGSGRWASRIQTILSSIGRNPMCIADSRARVKESPAAFRSRMSADFQISGSQVAWLCVPPGPHVALLIQAALDANLHVIAEKPWRCSREITQELLKQARKKGRLVAVHYEYCLLREVEAWRSTFYPGRGLSFSGRYFSGRADHLGIPAAENLGSHLLSIRAYAVPEAELADIQCGYNKPSERRVWLEKAGERKGAINLLDTKEPVIQRFIEKVESAVDGKEFSFGLEFALRVAEDVARLSRDQLSVF